MADRLLLYQQPEISENERKMFLLQCKRALLLALKEQNLIDETTLQTALKELER